MVLGLLRDAGVTDPERVAAMPGATVERVRWLVEDGCRRKREGYIESAAGWIVAGVRERREPPPGWAEAYRAQAESDARHRAELRRLAAESPRRVSAAAAALVSRCQGYGRELMHTAAGGNLAPLLGEGESPRAMRRALLRSMGVEP